MGSNFANRLHAAQLAIKQLRDAMGAKVEEKKNERDEMRSHYMDALYEALVDTATLLERIDRQIVLPEDVEEETGL